MATKTIPLDSQLRELTRKLIALSDDIEGKKLVGKNGGPLRQSLFQAAKVIEEEAERQVHVGQTVSSSRGDGSRGGFLRESIGKERVRKPELIPANEAFWVRPNTKKYDVWYWRFEEFGTVKRPPHPFLRPAFDLKAGEALSVFTNTLRNKIRLIERKLSRGVA